MKLSLITRILCRCAKRYHYFNEFAKLITPIEIDIAVQNYFLKSTTFITSALMHYKIAHSEEKNKLNKFQANLNLMEKDLSIILKILYLSVFNETLQYYPPSMFEKFISYLNNDWSSSYNDYTKQYIYGDSSIYFIPHTFFLLLNVSDLKLWYSFATDVEYKFIKKLTTK